MFNLSWISLDYWILFAFAIISMFLCCLLLIMSVLLIFQNRDEEKMSSYECGFQPFEDTSQKFDIKYYLVAILFLLFDLEIVFLFPWLQISKLVGIMGVFMFLFILVIAFMYEWQKGALQWN